MKFFLTGIIGLLGFVGDPYSPDEMRFVGSMPCHELLNVVLDKHPQSKCEFMKWDLLINPDYTVILKITYGESQPNTNGFKPGKVEKNFSGALSWQGNTWKIKLVGDRELTFRKLDNNVLHLMNGKEFLTGNGGFSFTLNRTPASHAGLFDQTHDLEIKAGVFDGRTPCHELSTLLKLTPTDSQCLKRKWRLKLSKTSPRTGAFELITVNYRDDSNQLKGNWRMESGLLELDFTNRGKLCLLPVSENVFHFLDADKQLLVGNADFSYALNRIPEH